jgi:hypothetical protein
MLEVAHHLVGFCVDGSGLDDGLLFGLGGPDFYGF